MNKNIDNEAMLNHLAEMAERILDDELFEDPESAGVEFRRAQHLQTIVKTYNDTRANMLEEENIKIKQKQTSLEILQTAKMLGLNISNPRQILGIE